MDTKKWYTSKTLIGIAVTVLGLILKTSGYTIGDADVTDLVTTLFQAVGLGVAFYGRIVAQHKLVK